jgi:hypothetical protein
MMSIIHQLGRFLVVVVALALPACSKNPLEKYGVSYKITSGRSPTFNHVQLYREVAGVKKPGPEITGTDLQVRFEDVTGDGTQEIIIFSDTFAEQIVHVQLQLDSGAPFDFKVLRRDYLEVNYPVAGLHWP